MLALKLCVIFSCISQCLMTSGRKYDLDQEAYKLYGEDFKSVLRRFRKTPDYLKILNDKMYDLKVYVKDMSLQVLHYYHGKMTQRVNDIIGVTKQYVEETATATPGPALSERRMLMDYERKTRDDPRRYYHASYARRQGLDDEPDRTGVKKLDEYSAFNHALSVSERNSFRDLGFEFAGNLIHSIIHNMGPVSETQAPKSTRLPHGGDPEKGPTTTSEHPHTHEVTVSSTIGIKEDVHSTDPEQTTETFRFRYRPHP